MIDQAIDNAVNSGTTYVTAAGNSADSGFEQTASFVNVNGREEINFNATAAAATRMTINVTETGPFTFEWDNAYDGVTGTVTASLDIYLYSADGTVLEYEGVDNAFATGVPVQYLGYVLPGTYQVEIVASPGTSVANLPGHYEFDIASNAGSAISSTEYAGLRTTVVGHAAFSDAISTAAVDYSSAPPYSTAAPIPTEDFTAQGPAIEVRNAGGTLLPAPLTVDKPDVSGTDGNNTSFFDEIGPEDPSKTLPQFFGTSSASGNLAGCVALLIQADRGATPAQILSALEATALPVNGQTAGTYNVTAGYGLVDTVAAAAKLMSEETAGAPVPTIEPVTPDPTATPVNSIDIDFSAPVTGFTIADLALTLAGGANLLTANQTLTTTNNQDFVLGNLSSVTTADGDYELALSPAGAGITGTNGVGLVTGATAFFVVESIPGIPLPPTIEAVSDSTDSVQVTLNEAEGGGTGFVLERDINPSFTGKVTSTYLSGTTTSYTDTSVLPGTVYYYRADAYNKDGTSIFSRASTVITLGIGEVILNNNSAEGVKVSGAWTASTAVTGYEGTSYLQDDDSGKGTKTVTFTPDLSTAGEYDVYATWTTASDRSTAVPFEIYGQSGDHLQTVNENERSTGGDGWVLIGEYFLHSSTASFVRITNVGTAGEVIANAVKFLPVNDIEREDGQINLPPTTTTSTPATVRATSTPAVSTQSADTAEIKALREELE